MNTVKINSLNTKMVAHRGVSGLEPENTVAAFVAAGWRAKMVKRERCVGRVAEHH